MNTKKSIRVLNSLLEINTGRIEGYKAASSETKNDELISLFSQLIASATKCREELTAAVLQLDGTVEEGTPNSGPFFSSWAELKQALNNNDRKMVLNCCEHGEDKTLDAYNNALTHDVDFLTIEQHKMIYKQYVLLKEDHDKIKSVQDLHLEHQL